MNRKIWIPRIAGVLFVLLSMSGAAWCEDVTATSDKPVAVDKTRDDHVPWGVATGSEWFSAFPMFNPLLRKAGVGWLRGFYEWQTIEPKRGYFNWALTDRLVRNARDNQLRLTGGFFYFTPWASADGGTRQFPIKDIAYWREYVSAVVGRYHDDIKYWEVWNEFNGSFAPGGTPARYAELVKEADLAAKKIDPDARIGMSVANFDVGFLDAAIKAGAAGHFDYICVHPYEKLGALSSGGEIAFLSMAKTLRDMLAANHQRPDMPLWITEIGAETSIRPDPVGDLFQATLLAKAYLLAIASGFERVFWFEARGPTYTSMKDHGLIRSDFSLRPSYFTLQTLSRTIGAEPKPEGWVVIGDRGYGFLFSSNGKFTLAAWAPPKTEIKMKFSGDVQVVSLSGESKPLAAGHAFDLYDEPVLVTDVPQDIIAQAQANSGKPYPWGSAPEKADTVSVRLQATNTDNGLSQVNTDTTLPADVDGVSVRRLNFSRADGEGHYAYFLVDPGFLPYGTRHLEVKATVRRLDPGSVAGAGLNYESTNGYVDAGYRNIDAGDQWHDVSWIVTDANFVGGWGWNFRLNAAGSPNGFLIKDVQVRKLAD